MAALRDRWCPNEHRCQRCPRPAKLCGCYLLTSLSWRRCFLSRYTRQLAQKTMPYSLTYLFDYEFTNRIAKQLIQFARGGEIVLTDTLAQFSKLGVRHL